MYRRNLKFSELRSANVTRCETAYHGIDKWSPTDWACAFAGEVGEACNLIKKLRRIDTNPELQIKSAPELVQEIGAELADAIIYADLLAARLGIDLSKAVIAKFNIVSNRVKSDIKL